MLLLPPQEALVDTADCQVALAVNWRLPVKISIGRKMGGKGHRSVASGFEIHNRHVQHCDGISVQAAGTGGCGSQGGMKSPPAHQHHAAALEV
jgi:hypothetical protein